MLLLSEVVKETGHGRVRQPRPVIKFVCNISGGNDTVTKNMLTTSMAHFIKPTDVSDLFVSFAPSL